MSTAAETRPRFRGLQRLSRLPVLIALVALLVLPPSIATAFADQGNDQLPTIVLVHGAWADPSSWDDVLPKLHDDGFRTATPRLGLDSLPADVDTVRATLDAIPGKKILVAHSYGGAVISAASYGRSDVLALVYSAAFVPDESDSLASLGTGFSLTGVVNHLIWSAAPFAPGSAALIDPAFFQQYFAQDLTTQEATRLAAAQQAFTFIPIFVTPSEPVGWHTIPSWYAVSGSDRIIDPAEERFMAARAGATTIEFPDASHVGGITVHSGRFTGLIEQAVEATTQQGQQA